MSLMKTLGTLAAAESRHANEAREDAWRRYPALLESNSSDPKAVREMQDVMKTLGKSVTDVQADHAALQVHRRLEQEIASMPNLEAARDAAVKATEAYTVETIRIREERKRGYFQTLNAQHVAENAVSSAVDASNKLNDHRARHGWLAAALSLPG